MVVNLVIRRLALAVLALKLALLPAVTLAQPSVSLVDAWVASLNQQLTLASWSHAVVLRQSTLETLPSRQARLQAELDTLVASARLSGDGELAQGLSEWRARVADANLDESRTPGRHDLPWIAADLRRNLSLSEVTHRGLCEPPPWVEVWHYRGISRLDWQPGMTLPTLLAALPDDARQGAVSAMVITPVGESHSRGVASWNREATPLAAGSRVMLTLPEDQGLRAAMPFPGTVEEAGWVNERLPTFLATRLPADNCTLWK